MRFRNLLLASFAAVFFTGIPAFAQPFIGHVVSLGVAGGTSLTDAFSDRTIVELNARTHYFSGSKDYIVGPMLEVRLPASLAVEVDALYRPMKLTTAVFVTVAPSSSTSTAVNSWEFPLLAKYRFKTPLIKPLVEVGPSFRHVSPFSGDSPHLSAAGFTVGAGVSFGVPHLRVEPQVRYTRWGSDSRPSTSFFDPRSNVDQAEFLLGLSF